MYVWYKQFVYLLIVSINAINDCINQLNITNSKLGAKKGAELWQALIKV